MVSFECHGVIYVEVFCRLEEFKMGGCSSSNSNSVDYSKQSSEEYLDAKTLRSKQMRKVVFEEKTDLNHKPELTDSMRKDLETSRLIEKAVANNQYLDWVQEEERNYIVKYASKRLISKGENAIKQGEDGNEFFIVAAGKFNVIDEDSHDVVYQYKKGGSFGELALLFNAPRSKTIVCTEEDGELWVVERSVFRIAMAAAHAKSRDNDIKLLKKVELFQRLSAGVLDKIINASSHEIFEPGAVIIEKGQIGHTLYVIQEGECIVSGFEVQGDQPATAVKRAGDYFGEHAIREANCKRDATVTAKTRCDLFYIQYDDFNAAVGSLSDLLTEQETFETLREVEALAGLSNDECRTAAKKFKKMTFSSGDAIIKENTTGKYFFIISQGTVQVSTLQGGELATLKEGQHFGEMSLLSDKKTTATVTATTNVDLLSLSASDFSDVVDGQIENGLLKTAQARQEEKRALVEKNIPYSELKVVANLGAGTFGRVKQVTFKKEVYALKILHKAEIVRHKQQDNVINEKNIMMMCHHPLILRLHTTYKDRYRVFMLLEFCGGGELFSRIHHAESHKRDGLPEQAARFYGFGVALALSYLRQHHIAYRDLKPENMLVDQDGYPKLIDFGFAKVLSGQTWTLCGTPEYMAPEIILGRGYDFSVDWWAFGILIYEMLAGYSPFCDPSGVDQRVVCQNIVQGKLRFKHGKVFKTDSKNIITKLLSREKSNRPGTGPRGGAEVTGQPWFSCMDTDTYLNKSVKQVPWIPPSNPLDVSNFYPCDSDDAFDKNFQDKSNWDKDF